MVDRRRLLQANDGRKDGPADPEAMDRQLIGGWVMLQHNFLHHKML
jgi:hypothetical protein